MRTKIIKYLPLLPVLICCSCKKGWVDTKPYGNPSTAYQWDDSTDAIKSSASLYVAMKDENTWGRNLFWMQNASDDLIVGRTKPDAQNIKNFVCTGHESYMADGWTDLYSMLAKANLAIVGIKASTGLSGSLKNRCL
jgi:hypothetical protein